MKGRKKLKWSIKSQEKICFHFEFEMWELWECLSMESYDDRAKTETALDACSGWLNVCSMHCAMGCDNNMKYIQMRNYK